MEKLRMGANAIFAPIASKHSTSDLTQCTIIAKSLPNRSGKCYKRIARAVVSEELAAQVDLLTIRPVASCVQRANKLNWFIMPKCKLFKPRKSVQMNCGLLCKKTKAMCSW